MNDLTFTSTCFDGVFVLHPKTYSDHRGFFRETYNAIKITKNKIHTKRFVQDNHSRSAYGVLRGLHYQVMFPQTKLVSCISGMIYDVIVDIRVDSPTFGRYAGFTLSEVNQDQLLVPAGFAHGFIVRSGRADVIYKCTDYYHSDDDGGILWSDPDLNIPWEQAAPLLSPKDSNYPRLRDIDKSKLPNMSVGIDFL